MPPMPFVYLMLCYRRKMNVSYWEARDLPMGVLYADLEMLELEGEYGPQSAKPPTPAEPKVP